MTEPVSKAFASAFAAIVGRPSAGKSTLLNALCGHKVSIISKVPQTTRNRIRGVVNRPGGQIVFVDTPGFHESERTFNRHMRGLIEETIRDVELVLYVVDASRSVGEEERALAATVAGHAGHVPVVVAINKIDIAKPAAVQATAAWAAEVLPDAPQVRVSAATGRGIGDVVDALIERAPAGEPVYPADIYTDQPPEFRIAELIREKAINATGQEVPHSIYVEVADMEVRDEDAETPLLWIRAFVLVERESQKGIVVGKGGAKIKSIRTSAQKDIAELFPYRIHLDLRVKVDAKWRRKEGLLRRLVY
jgi:GTP-binding protein Era